MRNEPPAVLDRLFREHEPPVRAFIQRRVSSRAITDDVVAETFMAATMALHSDPHRHLALGWFYTVARRRLHDHWRSQQRLSHVTMTEHPGISSFDADGLVTSLVVAGALTRLPERQRDALRTRYLLGGSVEDVAAQDGCTYQSAESLLARGRRSFAKAYEAA